MNCNRICQFQFFRHIKSVFHLSRLVKLYLYCLCVLIDLRNHAHIAVKHAHTLIHSQAELRRHFPLELIIILNLHYLITLTEKTSVYFFLRLFLILRIQIPLKDHIQPLHSKQALSRRSHNLYLSGQSSHILREFLLNKHNGHANDSVCILSL